MEGWPGSGAEASVYKEMGSYNNSKDVFDPGQYLLADLEYPLSHILIPSYKAPTANRQKNKEFNHCIENSRVRNEHMIGILKGWCASLKGMRLQIYEHKHKHAYHRWITAFCVLQNMLTHFKYTWEDLAPSEQNTPQDGLIYDELELVQEFRNSIRDRCVYHNYCNGNQPIFNNY
ncbi:hypothetical protein O181_080539 [Austropuccinia psidii MF-1]|uniref:DDE Tnp4 domain-containing protein n=1 Tax=Austropuccinia psidii MF-1 TaxID=1389203 RepID=A0A9Q3FKL4_9BASI|nr:hypothetical protein [Austropuccinia psidii MF-1]